MVGFYDLPEELVAKILLELPIESLLCVKRVKKSWYHLIKNKAFVTDHLLKQSNTSTSATSSLLIFNYYLHSTSAERNIIVDEFIRICNSNDSEIEHVQSIIQSFIDDFGPPEHFPTNYSFAIHCNGIICLGNYSGKFICFLNPALRKLKLLTPPPNPFQNNSEECLTMVGFGHDSTNNLYKVIRVVVSKFVIGAQIHTLGIDEDNSWRDVDIQNIKEIQIHLVSHYDQQLQCRGVYYWLLNESYSSQTILSFDFHDEKFQIISLPSHDFTYTTRMMLTLWNQSVVLFKCGFRSPLEMWVMHEEKINCWTKHQTISHFAFKCKAMVFWKNDELIVKSCFFNHPDHLASYNLRTQQLKRLQHLLIMERPIYAFAYTKTLAWIH